MHGTGHGRPSPALPPLAGSGHPEDCESGSAKAPGFPRPGAFRMRDQTRPLTERGLRRSMPLEIEPITTAPSNAIQIPLDRRTTTYVDGLEKEPPAGRRQTRRAG